MYRLPTNHAKLDIILCTQSWTNFGFFRQKLELSWELDKCRNRGKYSKINQPKCLREGYVGEGCVVSAREQKRLWQHRNHEGVNE